MNNVFTAVCMYPEYATEDYGTDTVIRTVEASRLVQRIAIREAYVAIKQPSNFQVIAVFPGHVRPATSASSPTGATHPHPPTGRSG